MASTSRIQALAPGGALWALVALAGVGIGALLGGGQSAADAGPLAPNALARRVAALETSVGTLKTTVAAQGTRIGTLEAMAADQVAKVAELRDRLAHYSRAGDDIYITGANLHIVNGLGATNGNPGNPGAFDPGLTVTNGLGNLIVGYNELRGPGGGDWRTGSHNIICGLGNNYGSFGGLIAGRFNEIGRAYASVSGGHQNPANGPFASVSGGVQNAAYGDTASISGGSGNTASGLFASVSGGQSRTAAGTGSWQPFLVGQPLTHSH